MSEFGSLEFGDTWELHYQGSDANSFLEANSDKYANFFNLKKNKSRNLDYYKQTFTKFTYAYPINLGANLWIWVLKEFGDTWESLLSFHIDFIKLA